MTEIYGVPLNYWPLTRTDNRPNRRFPNGKADWITVHETDNWDDGATAEATARYQHNGSGGRQASWHDSVDHLEIWQTLRDDEQGWHAGDGGGPGNTRSRGLEICVNFDGARRVKAIHNAARRVAYLLDNGHGRRGVVQHNHWSGKHCPRGIREGYPMDWQAFMLLVGEYRQNGPPKEDESMEEQAEKLAELEQRVVRLNTVMVSRERLRRLASDADNPDEVVRAVEALQKQGFEL